jgi:hypothetical protein
VRGFNAQLKVNASQNGSTWEIPQGGLVERSELADPRPRATSHPVTKLNIDTGDNWLVRGNLIRDFHKNAGDFVSSGAFMKRGGSNGVFERNLVLCTRDVATGGTRIGLSFGGGGTGGAFCAPAFDANVPCDPEHSGGIMRNNVIANCSDAGIYLNKARSTQVLFNTLVSTSGVDFRFASSTGSAHGNVLAGNLRGREGGTFVAGTNLLNVTSATFAGWYQEPLRGNLTVRGNVSTLIGAAAAWPQVVDDFCGRPRPAQGAYTLGALEHALGDCPGWPADGGSASPGDGGLDGGGVPPVDSGVGSDGGWVRSVLPMKRLPVEAAAPRVRGWAPRFVSWPWGLLRSPVLGAVPAGSSSRRPAGPPAVRPCPGARGVLRQLAKASRAVGQFVHGAAETGGAPHSLEERRTGAAVGTDPAEGFAARCSFRGAGPSRVQGEDPCPVSSCGWLRWLS